MELDITFAVAACFILLRPRQYNTTNTRFRGRIVHVESGDTPREIYGMLIVLAPFPPTVR
jgi:hypothetical protein